MSFSDLWQTYRPLVRSSHFRTVAATGVLIIAAWLVSLAGVDVPYLAEGIALAAVGIGGLGIVWGALQGLRQRQVNVDELVSIAVIASVLAGEYLSAGLVVFMMIFGQLLEEATSQRATAALEHLAALQPERAHRMDGDAIQEVKVEDLQPGGHRAGKAGRAAAGRRSGRGGHSGSGRGLGYGRIAPRAQRTGAPGVCGYVEPGWCSHHPHRGRGRTCVCGPDWALVGCIGRGARADCARGGPLRPLLYACNSCCCRRYLADFR